MVPHKSNWINNYINFLYRASALNSKCDQRGSDLFFCKEKLERRKFLNYLAGFHYFVPLKKDNGASGSDAVYQGLSLCKSVFLSYTHSHTLCFSSCSKTLWATYLDSILNELLNKKKHFFTSSEEHKRRVFEEYSGYSFQNNDRK